MTGSHLSEMSSSDVNRNRGSVHSIMTLPAYRPSPNADERLIAREGERAGVDTVIEFPETAEEEEDRREEDMEALYQIRQARRREIEERAERRRQRQEARQAGDWARLEQLRLEDQRRNRERPRADSAGSSSTQFPTSTAGGPSDSSTNVSSSLLIAEHNARTSSRDRRVSSVSYAELGLARHDGSRLRADSTDSDHRPLLDSAAGMGAGGAGSNRSANSSRRGSLRNAASVPSLPQHLRSHSSQQNLTQNHQHNRGRSAESINTAPESDPPTFTSNNNQSVDEGRQITPAGKTSAERSTSIDSSPRAGAIRTPSGSSGDSENSPLPPPPPLHPPSYEDASEAEDSDLGEEAPPYSSPVQTRHGEDEDGAGPRTRAADSAASERDEGRRLPTLNVVPSIEITDSTPISARFVNTPTTGTDNHTESAGE